MNRNTVLAGVLICASAFAANAPEMVTSKRGDLPLLRQPGGEVFCTAGFGEELKVLGRQGEGVLVDARCGRGWVEVSTIQKVAGAVADRSVTLDAVDVLGRNDVSYLTNVFRDAVILPPEVEMERSFRDFLNHTVDRESLERRHGEN